jgi:hypothetical protein
MKKGFNHWQKPDQKGQVVAKFLTFLVYGQSDQVPLLWRKPAALLLFSKRILTYRKRT